MKLKGIEFRCRGIGCCDRSKGLSGRMLLGLADLIQRLEFERGGVGLEVRVTSGVSCDKHYRMIGEGLRRDHQEGNAVHVQVLNVTPIEVNAAALKIPVLRCGGIGMYERFVHLDVREDGPAWWKGRCPKVGKLGPKIMRVKTGSLEVKGGKL